MNKNHFKIYLSLFTLLSLSITISIIFGQIIINLFEMTQVNKVILFNLRIPRVLLSSIVGAMLSVSGAILQGVLKNPLADPYILGVSSGGALGAVVAFIFGLPIIFVFLFSFLGAISSLLIIYFFSKVFFDLRTEILVLLGIALSSFLNSILVVLILFNTNIKSIYFWLFGTFSFANYDFVLISVISGFIGISISIIFSQKLNLLLLQDEEAASLGINVNATRFIFMFIATFLSAVSISMCGIIGFVGLICPHISRFLVGGNYKNLLPASALVGAIILVLADFISRIIFYPIEIPIGIVVSFIGVPFLVYLIKSKNYG